MFPKGNNKYNGNYFIKVPSCEIHNNNFSSDDEYFAYVHAAKGGADDNYVNPIQDKLLRALARNPHLRDTFFKDRIPIWKKNIENGLLQLTEAYNLDFERVHRIIEKISKALIFYENNIIINSKPTIMDIETLYKTRSYYIVEALENSIYCSSYPEIYKYRIMNSDSKDEIFIFLSFYNTSYYIVSYSI